MPPILDLNQCIAELWEEGTVRGCGLLRRTRFRAVGKTWHGDAERARGRMPWCATGEKALGAQLGRARVLGPFYVSWAQRRPSDLESRVRMTWAEHSNGLILRFRPITVWCYLYF